MEKERRPLVTFAYSLLGMLGILALYVLSIGPAFKLHERGFNSAGVVESAYGPLAWLCNQSESAGDLIITYVELWGVPVEVEVNGQP